MEIPKLKLPLKGVGKKIESMVRKALYEFSMLEGKKSLAVALSGGKDSLTLLFMLKAIIGRGFEDIDLHAIYIDGDYSCGSSIEKKFLQSICENLKIKFTSKELKNDIKASNCYVCARKRRNLIFEIAKENGIDTIAFGHHKDDNIQTLLLNLFHKGEFEGMMPNIKFKKIDVTIIRPLIYVSEQEIITFSKQNNFLRTFCKCPLGQTSKRNKISKIIKEIESDFPNIKTNLSLSSFTYSFNKAQNI
ncbi:MAG: tRNA lysidine(34) synthetase TilS [Parachlamydiales bacterium]|nr:tRNA lysidine(34) synthetase TilS [Parachlamydiales bacterium]